MTDEHLEEIFHKHIDIETGLWYNPPKDKILSAMREAVQVEVESNNKGMCNIICEATDTLALANQPLTIGEIRDMIKLYKYREAEKGCIEFANWIMQNADPYEDKWARYRDVSKSDFSYETMDSEQLYQEYIKSLNK